MQNKLLKLVPYSQQFKTSSGHYNINNTEVVIDRISARVVYIKHNTIIP